MGKKNRHHLSVLAPAIVIVLSFIVMTSSAVRAATQQIAGNPLLIDSYDTGSMAAAVWDGEEYIYQYFDDNNWGTCLFLDKEGDIPLAYGDNYHTTWEDTGMVEFTAVSNTKPDAGEILTVMDAGTSGVRVSRRVQYTEGNAYFKITWTITNNGSSTYTNCSMIHGGDAYFADDDDASSYWDENLGMIYLRNPGVSGLMGFYGGPGSFPDAYDGGDYSDGVDLAVAGQLDNAADPEFQDAGYHLQWDRATLAPGATWTIIAYEKWTDAGLVQVLAPSFQSAEPGDTVTLAFTVQNFQEDEDTFDLAAASDLGWTVNLPDGDTVTLASGESATVNVEVTVPDGAEGLTDTVILTATSQTDDTILNSDSVDVGYEETPPPTPDLPYGSGTNNEGWCFLSTADTSSGAAGVLVLTAMFLGLFSLVLRRKA